MKNKKLIELLSEFPEDSEVRFMVFSELNIRRCDIPEENVMIRRNKHNGEVFVMLDTDRYRDEDTRTEVLKMDKIMSNVRNNAISNGDE